MAPNNRAIAAIRRISVEQVRILRETRGLTLAAIEAMPDKSLRRAVRRLDYPDTPRAREAYRLLQARDDRGRIPTQALLGALRQLDSLRLRRGARAQVGGVPTGAEVVPRSLGMRPPPAAGIARPRWVPIGPGNIGGRTRSLLIHPAQTSTMWAGSAGGGIWRTDDAGASWFPVDDLMQNLAVTCLVMDPNDPNLIYAGTGEGFSNLDSIRGGGIFRTVDGVTWSQISATSDPRFQRVNRLAMSADGTALLAATNDGLLRSADPARAVWTSVLATPVADVKCHPTDPTKAVAGSLVNGIAWFTTDGGASWTQATHSGIWEGRIEAAYSRADPETVYLSVAVNSGEIWRSTNGGRRYSRRKTRAADGTPAGYLGDQGWYDNVIWAGDPTNADLVIVGGIDLWRSVDGGDNLVDISTWWDPRSAHADQHGIVAHPDFDGVSNRIVFFTNDGGAFRTDNVHTVGNDPAPPRVAGWQELNNTFGITQFYSAAGNTATGVIVGGAQDNGTLAFHPQDGSENWRQIFGGDGGFCAADPSDPQVFYGEYVFLNIHRNVDGATSDDTAGDRYISGQFWNQVIGQWDWKPVPFRIPDAMNQRALFIAPFALDPNQPNRLLAGGESLWRTNDAKAPNTPTSGPSWARIKPPAGELISAVAIATGDSDLVWVGCERGQVWRSSNATAASPAWTRIDNQGASPLAVGRFCNQIMIVPASHDTVFAIFGGYVADNVWRTDDGGATWRVLGGLPAAPARAIALHPRVAGLIYLGTEVGVFASEDSGATWSPTNEGPTSCSVDDLFWLGETLICVTHGRGMFTIDLSQL
jgi:hypothetical protein